MKSFLERRDRWGHGYSLWLIVGVAFLTPFVAWSLSHVHLENDVAGWLPQNDPQARVLSWYEDLFPSDDTMLVSWDDCSLTDPRLAEVTDSLLGKSTNGEREGGSPYIEDVRLPTDLLRRMIREDIPIETALHRVQGILVGRGPLHIRLTDAGRLRGPYMQSEILDLANNEFGLHARVSTVSMPLPSSAGLDLEDEPSWKLHDALTEYLQGQPLYDMQLTWPDMHLQPEKTAAFRAALQDLRVVDVPEGADAADCVAESFFIPGTLAAMSVTLSEHGSAEKDEAIRVVRDALVAAGVAEEQIHLGGRPVVSARLNQAVAETGWNRAYPIWDLPHRSPILLSTLISFLLSLALLQSFRLTLLVQLVSVVTAIAAISLVPPTGGSMNMVLVVMPTLLLVLTTSAAIHMANYWKHSGVTDPTGSVVHATRVAWIPCVLASGTTAVGMASLMSSTLVPVRDFGVYSAIGCLISFGAVLYLLPSLMLYWPRTPSGVKATDSHIWNAFGQGLVRHHRLVVVGCLSLTLACGYGLRWFRTETKVIRYFPDHTRVVQDYEFLEQNLAGIVSVDTIIRFDTTIQEQMTFLDRARKVMEIQEALRTHPEISGTLSLASFLDLRQPDESAMSRLQRMQARRRETLVGQRIHKMLEEPTGDDSGDGEGVQSLIAIAKDDADWLEPGDAALNRKQDELWRVTCQAGILSDYDHGRLTRELDAITREHMALLESPGAGHIVTGLIPIFLRTQQAVLESLIRSFGLAFALIAVVMAVYLRNVRAALLTMIPNIMPVIVMFGVLSWADIRIDIGTMITASVALGIAVDGTLHLMTWFHRLIRQGVPRGDAVAQSLQHCGPALWQTSIVIGAGMLTLMPVELLLISRFGWIMAGIIFAALFCDIVLLPALLAGPLGRILERAAQRRADEAPAEPDAVTESTTLPIPDSGSRPTSPAHAGRPHWSRAAMIQGQTSPEHR